MNDHLCHGIIGRGYVRPATHPIFAKGDCRFIKIKVLCRLDPESKLPLGVDRPTRGSKRNRFGTNYGSYPRGKRIDLYPGGKSRRSQVLRQIQANPVIVTLKSQRSFPGPATLFPLATDHRPVRGRILGHAVVFEQAGPRTVIVKTEVKASFRISSAISSLKSTHAACLR